MVNISIQTTNAAKELLSKANLSKGQVIVIGCSTSEVEGSKIGTNSNVNTAKEIAQAILNVANEQGIFVAGQCCEHLNRAIIVEKEFAINHNLEIVSVIPAPKAGGSFATNLYQMLSEPVAVEFIKADAGLDIGATMIGMHLKHVAVPLRLENNRIGEAQVFGATTRPKFIGGPRAVYTDMSVR